MPAMSRRFGLAAAALAVPVLLATTCKSSTEPSLVATTITVAPASHTFSTVGRTQQFSATVLDQKGDTMRSVTVTWASSATGVLTVSSTGLATAVGNGTAQVTATSGGASGSASITVSLVAAQMTKVSGDAQTGTVGQPLGTAVAVQIRDSSGQAIQGATVAFAPVSGSGSVSALAPTTDSTGQARTTWTLGTKAGTNLDTLVVAAGAARVTFVATAAAGPASQVTKTAGDYQKTPAGQPVAVAPSVTVADQYGNPRAGESVTFAVTAGGGSVTGGTRVTGTNGSATVGSWTVGSSAGVNTLTTTVTGVTATAVFTDTVYVPGAPTAVAAVSGTDNLPGLVGYNVNIRPAVAVTDASSNPVPGAVVTFAVTGGGGSGTRLVDTTNNSGVAQVGSWQLGSSAGVNAMTATVTGLTGGGNPVTFADTGAVGVYNIQVQFYGPTPSAAFSAAIDSAAAKWERIVYRHVGAPIQVTDTAQICGAGEPKVNQQVTDILILATSTQIDGPGGILAEAGPCLIRTSNGLTVLGIMKFDSSDVTNMANAGQLNEVAVHEMNHVLGFGTLWTQSPNAWLQDPSDSGNPQATYFSGPQAQAEFDSIGGTTYTGSTLSPPGVPSHKPPVENCGATSPTPCGSGTINSHWLNPVFTNELMGGWITGTSMRLSVVSVAADGDLGYTVNYAGADPYTQTFTAPPAASAPAFNMGDDIWHGPIYTVDAVGRLVQVRAGR